VHYILSTYLTTILYNAGNPIFIIQYSPYRFSECAYILTAHSPYALKKFLQVSRKKWYQRKELAVQNSSVARKMVSLCTTWEKIFVVLYPYRIVHGFYHPGSPILGQKDTGSRIRIRNTELTKNPKYFEPKRIVTKVSET
jgi:hypothetical protein